MHVHACIHRAGMGHGDPASQCMLFRFVLSVYVVVCCVLCIDHCLQH
jgi:hypothetical protein